MKAQRARRLFAVSAIGVLMAGGATIGAAGTASAAVPSQAPTNFGCFDRGGHRWWNDDCGFGFDHRNNFDNGAVVVIVVA
ncbi:hypothetical protein [Streptomyces sp. NPDC051636]|uniref:hypothetical protein n=1 Tax=Streptomyces sp. NPDC051636 TaxID=3365663 RepID=UPI0037ACEA72